MSGLVRGDRRGDLHHLHERNGAFLHAGTAGGGQADHWQAFGGGPFDGSRHPLCGRDADRPAEETEFARRHRHPPAAELPFPGDHRFIWTRLPPGLGQVGGVGRIWPHVDRVSVPRPERARVQKQGKQIMRVHRAAPGHGRIAAQPAPAPGGPCPAPGDLGPRSRPPRHRRSSDLAPARFRRPPAGQYPGPATVPAMHLAAACLPQSATPPRSMPPGQVVSAARLPRHAAAIHPGRRWVRFPLLG